jgi:predicted O-linked N-acetylglucosamine transferase (SPINDLY family)
MSVQTELDAINAALRDQAWDAARLRAERLLKKHPHSPPAANALGVVARKLGNNQDAIRHFEQALALSQHAHEKATLQFNLAQCHASLGQTDKALAAFNKSLELKPHEVATVATFSNFLREQGRTMDAIAMLEATLIVHPAHPDLMLNLGVCFQESRQTDQAVVHYTSLLEQHPDHAIALYNMGCIQSEAGRLSSSQQYLKRAVTSAPDYLDAMSMLLRVSQQMCDWASVEPLEQAAVKAVESGQGVFPFAFLSLPASQAQQGLCAKRWFERRYGQRKPLLLPQRPSTDGRIRIGFLSSDFHDHPTARLLVQAIECMNRKRFWVAGFSCGPDDDSDMQQRIRQAFDHCVLVKGQGDAMLADTIAAMGIDILIDLGGYTANSRTGVLAFKPAPIQAQFLGYPGSLQMPTVDYVFTDRTVTPLDHLPHYSEKPAYLPHSYQCNDTRRKEHGAIDRSTEGLPHDAIVLASLNQSYKIRADLFASWCRILKRCDNTVLWLLRFNDEAVEFLQQAAARHGVDPKRLVFAKPAPNAWHQSRLALADIFLDTWLYNSHTTASDALWVKKPLVTLCGDTFASRVASSILKAAHLDALIAFSVDEYEALIEKLIKDPGFSRLIAKALATPRDVWPLFDTPAWTRAFESLLTQMHKRSSLGLPPQALFSQFTETDMPMNTAADTAQTHTPETNANSPEHERRELLIGCGSNHSKKLCLNGRNEWTNLVTLDYNGDHGPDIVHDLTQLPLPFADNSFDEIHAYEVLEHTGAQGDYRFFFAQFEEFWRVLKPGGVLMATCPSRHSPWAWGDPSHTRIVQPENLIFLDQGQYILQVGKTAMSDFRNIYSADFSTVFAKDDGSTFSFAIKAVKPSRHQRPAP